VLLLRPRTLPPKLFLLQLAGPWPRPLVLPTLLRPPPAAGLLVSRPAGRWLRRLRRLVLLALSLSLLLVVCPIALASALA
jgi:hypothetical protein